MSRKSRNARLRAENARYTDELEHIPESQWPLDALIARPPSLLELWRSKRFLVQIYTVPGGVERLSVIRTAYEAGKSERFKDGITWNDLQRLKRECGRGDRCAVELYPPDENLVDAANMRHLWVLPQPPGFMWTDKNILGADL